MATTLMQAMVGFAAAFGVAMTVLYRVAPSEPNAPRLSDLAITSAQMTVAFVLCISVVYLWGFAPVLRMMAKARRNWTTASLLLAPAKSSAHDCVH